MNVRAAGPGDAAVVHALTQAAFAPYATLTPPSGALRETEDDVRAALAAHPGALAYDGDVPVGCLRLPSARAASGPAGSRCIPARAGAACAGR